MFAYITGRTLVLPPDQPMYLLNKGAGKQKAHSFAEFFPFDIVRQRMEVITMKEFLTREAITGRLTHNETGAVLYPPQNKTEFVGTDRDDRNMVCICMYMYVYVCIYLYIYVFIYVFM